LRIDGPALQVRDGKVMHEPRGRSWTFGELTKDKKLSRTVRSDAAATPPADWKGTGTSLPKVDGRAIVTGKHRYTPDIKAPGMVFGKVLRPYSFGATLVSVDLKPAEAMSGVSAVSEGDFVGVTAPTEAAAEQALAAIKAEWKATP